MGLTRFHFATAIGLILGLAVIFGADGFWLWAGLGLIIPAYAVALGLGAAVVSLNFFGESVCRGEAGRPEVALTFDDGPDPEGTPAVLRVLAERGAPAAFFFKGRNVEKYPDLARRAAAEGHIIGNHSYGHPWWINFLWGQRLRNEIEAAQQAIESATGLKPAYYRPPVGLTNPHLFGVLRKLGLTSVGWDVRPLDRFKPAEVVEARVLNRVRAGSIIILHDSGRNPEELADLVDRLIREIEARGLTLVSLDRLVGRPAYLTGLEKKPPAF